MSVTALTKRRRMTTSIAMKGWAAIGLAMGTGACVNVTAPDKPIEINLNIAVTQQVVYRLDGEAKSLIQQNPGGIF
ncbi:YnbE family lipoprotein [Sphingomonas sp. MA1305]|nr:YnbE family lipoprotein [Sphingomonas sp. MA1305]